MPELDPGRPLDVQVRELVAGAIGEAIDALATIAGDEERATAVHTARKRCKEARALLRLGTDVDDPAARRIDRRVRRAAHTLAPIRDAHVADALIAEYGLCCERTGFDDSIVLAAADRSGTDLRRALDQLGELRFDTDPAILREGFRTTYGRSRRAYLRASRDPSPHRLHRWRTWNKRVWYQVRLLTAAAPLTLDPLVALLDVLGETIGDQHDVTVVLDHSASAGGSASTARAAMEERSAELAARALRWGASVYVETDDAFADRVVGLWSAAVDGGPEPRLGAAPASH